MVLAQQTQSTSLAPLTLSFWRDRKMRSHNLQQQGRGAYRDLRETDHLEDLRRRWEVDIKMDPQKWEMVWLGMHWSGLGLGEFVDNFEFGTEP